MISLQSVSLTQAINIQSLHKSLKDVFNSTVLSTFSKLVSFFQVSVLQELLLSVQATLHSTSILFSVRREAHSPQIGTMLASKDIIIPPLSTVRFCWSWGIYTVYCAMHEPEVGLSYCLLLSLAAVHDVNSFRCFSDWLGIKGLEVTCRKSYSSAKVADMLGRNTIFG